MSQELSKTKKAEECFALVEDLKKCMSESVKNYLVIGRTLTLMQEKKLWRYYGDHLKTFDDFLKEIHFGHSTAYNCMKIFKSFSRNLEARKQLPEYTRLVKLLPVANPENTDEWLDKAETMPLPDLEDEIRIAKGGISNLECQHPNIEFYIKCKDCKKFMKRSFQEIEKIYNAKDIKEGVS